MNKYWLHRISYENEVSGSFIEKEWLTLGWSQFVETTILTGTGIVDKAYEAYENTYKSSNT